MGLSDVMNPQVRAEIIKNILNFLRSNSEAFDFLDANLSNDCNSIELQFELQSMPGKIIPIFIELCTKTITDMDISIPYLSYSSILPLPLKPGYELINEFIFQTLQVMFNNIPFVEIGLFDADNDNFLISLRSTKILNDFNWEKIRNKSDVDVYDLILFIPLLRNTAEYLIEELLSRLQSRS